MAPGVPHRHGRYSLRSHASRLAAAGINVGGHTSSRWPACALVRGLGCEDVETYLQSGNVVFRRTRDPADVGRGVERAIKRDSASRSGSSTERTQLTAIVAADPFHGVDPSRQFVMFLSGDPGADRPQLITCAGPDEAVLMGGTHLNCLMASAIKCRLLTRSDSGSRRRPATGGRSPTST